MRGMFANGLVRRPSPHEFESVHDMGDEDVNARNMMRLPIVLVFIASAANAQVTVDVAKISCQQFLSDKIAPTKNVALWLSGYYNGRKGNTVIDVGAMQKSVDKVEDYCRLNLEMMVMEAVKNALGIDDK